MCNAHIHLSEAKDELVWSFNTSGGRYSTKLGYDVQNFNLEDGPWWSKKIWKIKAPLKGILFFLVSDERMSFDLGSTPKEE